MPFGDRSILESREEICLAEPLPAGWGGGLGRSVTSAGLEPVAQRAGTGVEGAGGARRAPELGRAQDRPGAGEPGRAQAASSLDDHRDPAPARPVGWAR